MGRMKKPENMKDRILVPLSGVGATLFSIAATIFGLYLVTIVVRFLFIWSA
jgi:hypothetical protein